MRPPRKERLDVLLVKRGLAESRDKARRLIMAGKVLVSEQRVQRPASPTAPGERIRVLGPAHPYASRGGVKLESALEAFGIRVMGCHAADFGASTGGFTDCLLKRGAAHVYAIDVGTNQLDYRLRMDQRVTVMERFNVRYLTGKDLPESVHLVTIDLSFISALLALEPAGRILLPDGDILTLVKPQFEIGKGRVGRGGIVRDPEDHCEVLHAFASGSAQKGFTLRGVIPSPIRGAEGNLEFWFHLRRDGPALDEARLDEAVQIAHREIPRTAQH